MGVLRLFTSLAYALQVNSSRATKDGLDEIAADARMFSYIGNRRKLSKMVRQGGFELAERLRAIPIEKIERIVGTNKSLAQILKSVKINSANAKFDIINEWLGRQWEKNSGVFPDFLLALDEAETFGNGALLELKDTKGDSIASFNSTIPTRFKSLLDVKRITRKNLVVNAAQLFDFPLSADATFFSKQRRCFYLIRTCSTDKYKVRISLVEGSFFETLPKDQLLALVWEQILDAGGVSPAERPHIVELLASLEQAQIAKTREIKNASVKPRLRLMAEVHPDAKVHSYSEVKARTVNLVIKRESGFDEKWLRNEFEKDGVKVELGQHGGDSILVLRDGGSEINLRYLVIMHKRNGEHIVLQYNLR